MCEYPLPSAFTEQMRAQLGSQADAFFASYAQPPLRGVRFRDARRPLPPEELGAPIPYAVNACLLSADSPAGGLPLHEAGAYYLQEPSAMAAAAVLAPQDGERVLDLCAAPGGKSAQLAQSASLALLVANEPIPARAQVLSRNIERMGIGNAAVTCAYPEALAARWPDFFDKVLVDAPCSGEGMFRRHPETRAEWSPEAPARCHARQLAILRSAAALLRPGGRMAYSTCTFNEIENEGTVRAFLSEHPDFCLLPICVNGLPEAPDGMLRLWPHRFPGEGHFVALLEKAGDVPILPVSLAPLPKPGKAALALWQGFCDEAGCSLPANAFWNGRLLRAPDCLPPFNGLRVLRVGLHLGEARGSVFLPDHALALAGGVSRRLPLDGAQAAAYLHGEALPCGEALRGWYAVTAQGWPLGFAKASNGQLKNHYPKGLRK